MNDKNRWFLELSKNHKGVAITLETVLLLAAILLTVFIVILVFREGIGNFKDGLMCSGNDMTCGAVVKGDNPCGEGKGKVDTALLGCFGFGKVCCAPDDEAGGGSSGGTGPGTGFRAPSLQVVSSASGVAIASGRTITSIPEEPQSFTVTGSYDESHDLWKASAVVQDPRGNVLEDAFNPSIKSVVDDLNSKLKTDGNTFTGEFKDLKPKPEFMGERLKLTISIFPVDKADMKLEESIAKYPGKVQNHILYFDVKPALRYAGLTTQWTQSKTIRAACEFVDCDGIFFRIVSLDKNGDGLPDENIEGACSEPVPTSEELRNAKLLKEESQFCVFQNGKNIGGCQETLNDCMDNLDESTNGGNYGTAFDALMAMVRNGIIDEDDYTTTASQFATAQSKSSAAICLRDEPRYDSSAGAGKLYRAEVDSVTNRASFDLDLPFMTSQYLCVYGAQQDGDNNWHKVYSAGNPQQIKVDRKPPVAEIKFEPLKLNVNLRCRDYPEENPGAEASGCKENAYWVGYVNNIGNFVPALAGGSKMNAVAWCPPYQSSSGYSFTSKSQIKYQSNELRVMCLRVEDEAGNAAVTMTTVYNGYDMLAGALGAYLNE